MSIDVSTLAIEVRSTGIKQAAEELKQIATSGKAAEDRVKTLTESIGKLSKVFTEGAGTAAAFKQAMQGIDTSIGAQGASMSMLGKSMKELNSSTSVLNSGISGLSPKVRDSNVAIMSSAKVMDTAHAAARGLSGSLGALWITYGNLVPMMAGIAVGASLKGIVSVGKEVENTLENVRIMGQSTTEQVNQMREAIYNLGTGVKGPKDVAEAFQVLTLAGLNAKEAMQGIGAALNLSIVGGVSIEKASEVLVQVGTSLGYTADGFAHVGDVIAKTAAVSMSSVASISGAFKSAASVGELYGASLQDIGVSLATLSNLGIQGTAAGTALKNFYGDLSKSTDKVSVAFKAMKMSLADLKDADGYFLPIVEVVTKLDKGLSNLTGPERQKAMTMLFQERGVKDATGLFKALDTASTELNEKGEKYATKLEEINDRIHKSYGFAALGAIAMSQTTQGQLKAVANTLETTFLKAFQEVEPQIGSVARALSAAFKSDEFVSAIKNIAIAVADLTKWIVDHYNWIEKLILAYISFKGVGMVASLTQMGVAFGATTIAARGFALALGPIAVGIAAVSAAWLYFYNLKKSTESTFDKSAVKGFEAQVNAMKEANAALTTQIELRLKGETEQSIAAKMEEKRQQESISRAREASKFSLGVLEKEISEKTNKLTKFEKLKLELSREGKIDPSGAVKDVLDLEKELTATRKLNNKLIAEAEEAQEGVINKSKYLAEEQDRIAKEARIKNTGSGKIPTKDSEGSEKASFLKAERLNLEKLLETYRERTIAVQESADSELRVMANVEQARVTANFNNNKYASERIYLAELELAKLVDIAKFEQQKANAVAEQKNKITEIIRREEAYQKDAENSGGTRLGLIEKQTVALFRFNGESEESIKKWREMAKVSDEMVASEAARTKMKTATEKLNVDTGSLKQQADALFELGTAGKKSELAIAELQVAEGKFAGAADEFMTKQYLKAAASKDSAKAYLDAAKIAGELIDEQLNKEQALLDATLGIEQAKVSAIARSKNATIDLAMKGIEAEIAYNNAFEISSTSQIEQLNKLADLKEKFAVKTSENFKIAGLEDTGTVLEKMSKSVGNLGNSFSGAGKALKGFAESFKDMAAIEKQTAKDGNKNLEGRVAVYGNMAGAAKNFFKENTTGYKLLHSLETGLHVFQMAMQAEKLVTSLTTTAAITTAEVASQGVVTAAVTTGETARNAAKVPGVFMSFLSSLGPWGMAAAAIAIGAVLGGAFSGGGASVDVAKQRQETQSTGTVLGDDTAKSESIVNSLDKLVSDSNIALSHSSNMLVELRSIRDGISGMASFVSQSSGLRGTAADERSAGVGSSRTFLGFSSSSRELVDSGIVFDKVTTEANSLVNKAIMEKYKKSIEEFNANIAKSSDEESQYAYIYAPQKPELQKSSQTVGSVMDQGVSARGYQDIYEKKSSFFGLFNSSSNKTEFSDLKQGLKDQFGKTVSSMFASIVEAAAFLGKDKGVMSEALKSISFEQAGLDKISLKGLSGADIERELQSAFSMLGDKMAEVAMPAIAQFQKVGEGLFQTLVRVSSGVESARFELDKLNIASIDYTDIINKQGDTSTEIVRDSIIAFERMNNSAEGISNIIRTMDGVAQDLASTYKDLSVVREMMNSNGLNGNTLSSATIWGAGGIDNLKSGIQDYFKGFFTDVEQNASKLSALTKEFNSMGLSIPATKAEFKSLIQSLDNGSESGSKMVGKLLSMSGAFADVSDAIDAATKVATEAAKEAADAAAKAKEETLKLAQDGVNDAMSVLTKSVNAQKKAVQDKAALDKAAAQVQLKDATDLLSSLTGISNIFKTSLAALDPMSRKSAQDLLNSALSVSNGGGDISKIKGLQDAVSAVGKPSEQMFASLFDFQKDQQQTINTITSLKANTDKQVSEQQLTVNAINDTIKAIEDSTTKELARLDGIVSSAQAQIDAINGVTNAVLTVQEALFNLADALGVLKAAKGPQPTVAIPGFDSKEYKDSTSKLTNRVQDYGSQHGGDAYFLIKGVNDYAAKMANAENLVKQLGGSDPSKFGTISDAILNTTGKTQGYWAEVQRQFDSGMNPTTSSIPGFAVGTNYVPQDMLANIHAGERIIPAADNAELMNRLRNPQQGSETLIAEIKNLRQELSDIKATIVAGDVANVQATKEQVKMYKKWDSDGLPDVRNITA